MEEQVIRKLIELDQRVEGMAIPEKPIDLISPFLALPGLIGFWPMSVIQLSTGNVYDISSQARALTTNGNPTFNIYNNSIPYLQLDGTGDYLSRPDEADLDVLGNEAHNAAAVQGMSTGGWFWFDNLVAAFQGMICKADTVAANSSFEIFVQANGSLAFAISTGAAFISANSVAGVITSGSWFNVVCTYDPSTRMDIFVNGISVANQTVAVPATIPNTARAFTIGSFEAGVLPMTGRISNCFYSANLFPSALAQTIFQQTRAAYRI